MEIDETDGPASRHNSETRSNFKPEHFRDHTVIGKGKDSIIYSAFCDRIGDAPVAIKVYNKAKLSTSKLRAIKREAAMMIYMSRKKVPLITLFHCAFQDSKHIYIVMEHCTGGDLLERLLKEGRAMHEHRVALEVAHPLLSALARMHQLRIIHRDIKLENIFLDGEGRVKLGDFGLTMSMKQELAISPVGTVEYMAPEIVALPAVELVTSGQVQARDIKACDEKVDIWALGVTLYELLTGHLPFSGKDKQAIKKAIAAGQVKPMPASLSGPCAAFVEAMLTQDPLQRPSAEQLLQHPFLQMYLMRRQGKHQQPAAVAAPPVQDREPKPPRVEELLAAGSSLSDSFTSLDSRMRELQSREGSATSQMSLPLLPPSFTLRHNEVADSTLPEATVVKIECGARDSTDSLIRARHAALMECGSSTSSGSSMSLPAGQFDLSTAAGPTNSSPSKSRNLRMKKSPLQVETRSASADQMRAMTTSRSAFLPQPGSPTLFRKVGLYFKSMLGRDELPEKSAVSADQLQLPTNSHSRGF